MALADVTPEQVWEGWTGYYRDLGQQLTVGSRSRQGDTLVISDTQLSSSREGSSFALTLPELRLRDMGDGRVEVQMAPEIPVHVEAMPEDGKKVTTEAVVRQKDLRAVVSGTPDAMSYDLVVPEVAVEVTGMQAGREDVPLRMQFTLTDNTGTYALTQGASRGLVSKFHAAKMTFSLSGANPEDGSTVTAAGKADAIDFDSEVALPAQTDMADLRKALNDGFAAQGRIAYGNMDYTVDTASPEGKGSMSAHTDSADGSFSMSKAGLSYGGHGRGIEVSVNAPDVPVPIAASMSQAAFNFAMPLMKSDAAQPFAFLWDMDGVTISDALWAMFDPTAQLPRDPARLMVDLAGTARLDMDVFDPAMAETEKAPGQIDTVDIKALELRAAGAQLTGAGGGTIDNSGPVPMPQGAVDLKLVGGNALIDKLVAMKLLPQDQAMGARMMMGLFGVPQGEDTLTSKIEMKADGTIYANGQRLK